MQIYLAVILLFCFVGLSRAAEYTGIMIVDSIQNSSNPGDEAIKISTRGVVTNNNQPFSQFIATSNVTVPTATNFDMRFSSKIADRGNLVSNRLPTVIRIDKKGVYYVGANIRWASNATGTRQVQIRKNGAIMASSLRTATATDRTIQNISAVIFCLPDDALRVVVTQTSGGNLAIQSNDQEVNFTLVKLW